MAFAVTHIGAAAAAVAWMLVEWVAKGKPSLLGIASGAVAGLVAITPAAGFVLPSGALMIGLAAGIVCYWAATSLKHMMGYDDLLDVFGVHGVGGIVGAILTGVFAASARSAATPRAACSTAIPAQLWIQVKGMLWTVGWSAVATLRPAQADRPGHGPARRHATASARAWIWPCTARASPERSPSRFPP